MHACVSSTKRHIQALKPGCHLHKYANKSACIYALARAFVLLGQKLAILTTAQLARIYAHIYASGIQALTRRFSMHTIFIFD
jgi:hypothetical protein